MFDRLFRNRNGQGRGQGGGMGAGRGQGRSGGGSRGQGQGNKPGSGPDGNCVCPKCGKKFPHVAGVRCMDQTCPECNIRLVRE